MKETRFIAQNKEKWLESETLLNSPVKDPEKLSNLFTQVVDDLSYSRTYYPNRSVRVYLNKIARQYFSIIYSHKKKKRNRFKLFWLDELPQIILHSKRQLLISLIVFLVAVAIGIFSSRNDNQFASTILGDKYVAMTKANIEKGDPMAVYKESHQIDMFLGITLNNLMVAFRTYVFGIFLAIGSLAILLSNGIMVGCFQYFFVERGLFVESALTIWLHGTLEISSIILAGGAGLTLGTGLIFPGTYSRLQAFQISAIRSLKLMLGITPIFVLAAIIESFLTRYTDVPDIFKIVIILLSATFIVGYFVVYPWLKSKKGFEVPLSEVRLPPSIKEEVSYTRVKNNAEILKDTFLFFSRQSTRLLPWVVVASLAASVARFFYQQGHVAVYEGEWWQELLSEVAFALETPSPAFILINSICTTVVLYRAMKLVDAEATKTAFKINAKALIHILVLSGLMFFAISLGGWGIFVLLFVFAILLVMAYAQLAEKINFFAGVQQGWRLTIGNLRLTMELQLILLLLSFSFLLVLSAPIFYIYTNILQWNFAETDLWAKGIIKFVQVFVKTFSFYLVLPILAAAPAYFYYTLKEINTASHLKESIARLGTRTVRSTKR